MLQALQFITASKQEPYNLLLYALELMTVFPLATEELSHCTNSILRASIEEDSTGSNKKFLQKCKPYEACLATVSQETVPHLLNTNHEGFRKNWFFFSPNYYFYHLLSKGNIFHWETLRTASRKCTSGIQFLMISLSQECKHLRKRWVGPSSYQSQKVT